MFVISYGPEFKTHLVELTDAQSYLCVEPFD